MIAMHCPSIHTVYLHISLPYKPICSTSLYHVNEYKRRKKTAGKRTKLQQSSILA